MSDYAELVKNLRFCAAVATALDCDGCEWKGGKYSGLKDKDGAFLGCEEQIKLEAADAIEQLSTKLECLKSYMGEYKAAYIAEHDARMMEYRNRKEGTCPFIVCHDCKYRGIEAKMETWPCMDCCDGDRHEAVKRNAPKEETE